MPREAGGWLLPVRSRCMPGADRCPATLGRMSSPTLELKTPGFRAYLITQFLGALNDNAFKLTIISMILATTATASEEGRLSRDLQWLFAAPFMLFATWAGRVADRHRKSSVMLASKVAEVGVMLAAAAAFASGSPPMVLVVLGLMSVQSTFFGPAKYGYLGECVDARQLTAANGWVSLTTILAIILGSLVGPWVYQTFPERLGLGALIYVGIALVGTWTARSIPAAPAVQDPPPLAFNPLPELRAMGRGVLADRALALAVAGSFHFFLVGAVLQVDLLAYAEEVLGLTGPAGGAFFATSAIGIGAGSMLAQRLARRTVEPALIPVGALGLSVGIAALALVARDATGAVAPAYVPAFAMVALSGLGGGVFIVTVNAVAQHRAPAGAKGRFLAFNNFMGFAGVFAAGLVTWLTREAGLGAPGRALAVGVLSALLTLVGLAIYPAVLGRMRAVFAPRG